MRLLFVGAMLSASKRHGALSAAAPPILAFADCLAAEPTPSIGGVMAPCLGTAILRTPRASSTSHYLRNSFGGVVLLHRSSSTSSIHGATSMGLLLRLGRWAAPSSHRLRHQLGGVRRPSRDMGRQASLPRSTAARSKPPPAGRWTRQSNAAHRSTSSS